MPNELSNGKAYIAGWLIKMIAGGLLMVSIGWASHVGTTQQKQAQDLVRIETERKNMKEQLDRIERSVELLKTALVLSKP